LSDSCIFCRIAAKNIPSTIVYEDDDVVAFRDLSPQAPTHVLVIPKRHIASLDDVVASDAKLLGAMMLAAKGVAAASGLVGGYRIVTNCGAHAGQSVSHIHFHVLGGRPMAWPPG
jgi:histidine triad (HIT) family protein